ncbi:MAG TPA: T9SS type A sorting domain-containing protein [Tenuifilaceae bacterium]|nr:T9SS type A sorting domain-containing protein [Tenuifilaceae bacterium]
MKHKNKKGESRKVKGASTFLKAKRIGVAALLTFTFSLSTVMAQESINASGGKASGNGGSSDYSVGQVVYQTHTGSTGSVAEGVHQPYEISEVTGIDEAKGITLSVVAYPNPVNDHLMLKVDNYELLDLHYLLFDINGKLLQKGSITSSQTHIAVGNLAPATYIVKVIQGHREIKTFKIVKN